ncbi:MAG: NAD(P)H-dependent oxidoreductase [Proteobacteria bacterium]|nr:MAG: NAD(P)H-dependent oxidoreductase [Pseudomonadota bacterium]
MVPMNVLSICGSLRPNSYNLALLRELKDRLRPDTDSTIFDRLGEIPPFQPDIPCPEVITDLRAKIKSADAIIIASPEYVHGIPGILCQ